MSEAWSFPAPPEAPVVTQRGVAFLDRPVLVAIHDAEGDWWLLHEEEGRDQAHVSSAGALLRRDPDLAALADLPRGWRAERPAPGEPWARSELPG